MKEDIKELVAPVVSLKEMVEGFHNAKEGGPGFVEGALDPVRPWTWGIR